MRLARHRKLASVGMNMTPMIDIVFLLIIFFMVVSQVSRVREQPVVLPQIDRGGEALEAIDITINIDRKGQLLVAGQNLTLAETEQTLRRELIRLNGDPSLIRILVRCDRDADSAAVNQLIRTLEPLGIRNLRVSVEVDR